MPVDFASRLAQIAARHQLSQAGVDEIIALLADSGSNAGLRTVSLRDSGLVAEPVTLTQTPPQERPADTATLWLDGSGLDGAEHTVTEPVEKPALARFEDLGPIGRGGMGEVRRVRDRDLNRTMAMKIIHPGGLGSELTVARFIEESQVAAQLEHPSIVPVHETGRLLDGRIYFTMQEVRGRTLREVIHEVHTSFRGDGRGRSRASRWTPRRLVDTLHKVCEAVAYAHSRGVVHRDIKPSNIMVGDYGEVRVVDWGLAKVLGRRDRAAEAGALEQVRVGWGNRDAHASVAGLVAGTPMYMPPEQARGEIDALGPASDVYSLGAVLYEILSGKPPFSGSGPAAVLDQVKAGNIKPLSGELPIPDELREAALKAMAARPEDRFADAGALAAEIAAWLEGERNRERALATVERADEMLPEIDRLRRQGAAARREAEALLAPVKSHEPVERKRPGWAIEDEAARLEREADLLEVAYTQTLYGALSQFPDLPEASARLAEHYLARHRSAEAARDDGEASRYEALLRGVARGADATRVAAWLRGDGRLSLLCDPPGATVELLRYEIEDRRLITVPFQQLGPTPLREHRLPRGSYLAILRAPGRAAVRYPVSIGRMEHWDGVPPGADGPEPVRLPLVDSISEHEIYVPGGWFLAGGDPHVPLGMPHEHLWCDSFVLDRYPVSNDEYMTFLNDLCANGQEDEALRLAPRERSGRFGQEGALIYGRDRDGRFYLTRDGDGDQWHGDWPVLLVSWGAAMAYAAWRGRDGSGWRLPAELEWEKASRGVDGRLYPWGDFADATWFCNRESHAGRALPAGRDEFPVDASPYGVRFMAGNCREWCLDEYRPERPLLDGQRVLAVSGDGAGPRSQRGGSWSSIVATGRVVRRWGIAADGRLDNSGFRLLRPEVG